jgi:hypothetical protein
MGEQPDIGKIEYQSGCAACHGADGKGNGPVAGFLITKPADLTMITNKYNGAFPFGHIYDVIDGRQEVKAHGDRAMPVWGYRFSPPPVSGSNPVAPYFVDPVFDREAIIRARILAVIDYIYRIQPNPSCIPLFASIYCFAADRRSFDTQRQERSVDQLCGDQFGSQFGASLAEDRRTSRAADHALQQPQRFPLPERGRPQMRSGGIPSRKIPSKCDLLHIGPSLSPLKLPREGQCYPLRREHSRGAERWRMRH